MKKEEYIPIIADKCGVSKVVCDKVIEAFLEQFRRTLIMKDKVNITNVGVFSKTLIKPKVIFSPIDGSTLNAKSYYRITFTCSKNLIDCLKK